MSFFDRIMDAFRSRDYDDDDYDEYDEMYEYEDDKYDDEDEEEDDYEEIQPVRTSSKRRNSDYHKEESENRASRASSHASYSSSSRRSNITPLRRSMELALVRPGEMSDAQQISDYLLEGKAVVLNMESIIQTDLAQRILDFTSGATYTLDGKLQKVSNAIFVVTPSSVDLSGDFHNVISSESLNDATNLNVRMS